MLGQVLSISVISCGFVDRFYCLMEQPIHESTRNNTNTACLPQHQMTLHEKTKLMSS